MAELDVPVCLMHMRGDPTTMMGLKDYENDDIVSGVRSGHSFFFSPSFLARDADLLSYQEGAL